MSGSRADPSKQDALGDALIDRVIRAGIELRSAPTFRRSQSQLYRAGEVELSPTQVDILEALHGRAAASFGELSSTLRLDPAITSRVVPQLLKLGLVDREEHRSDRRVSVLSITPKGKRIIASVVERRRQLTRLALRKMPPDFPPHVLADMLEKWLEVNEQAVGTFFSPTGESE